MKCTIKMESGLLKEPFEETVTINGGDMTNNKFAIQLKEQSTFYNVISTLNDENDKRILESFAKYFGDRDSGWQSWLPSQQLKITLSLIERVLTKGINGSPEAWLAVFKMMFDSFNVVKFIYDLQHEYSYFNFTYIIQKGE